MRTSSRYTGLFALLVFAVTLSGGINGSADTERRDEVVLTCHSGGAAGEYMYTGDATEAFWGPLCFTVDGAGFLYIPESESAAGTRVHKFDEKGNFIVTLGIYALGAEPMQMAVACEGELYLTMLTRYRKVIYKYSSEGELRYCLGPKGSINHEELSSERPYDPDHEGYFAYIPLLTVTSDGDLLVQEGSGPPPGPVFYRFNSQGKLLEKGVEIPAEMATLTERKERLDRILRESLRGTNQKPLVYTLMAPDGHYYYMVYDDKELEIHRVTVMDEGTPSAPEGSVPES